jgi:hypothetical protein
MTNHVMKIDRNEPKTTFSPRRVGGRATYEYRSFFHIFRFGGWGIDQGCQMTKWFLFFIFYV